LIAVGPVEGAHAAAIPWAAAAAVAVVAVVVAAAAVAAAAVVVDAAAGEGGCGEAVPLKNAVATASR